MDISSRKLSVEALEFRKMLSLSAGMSEISTEKVLSEPVSVEVSNVGGLRAATLELSFDQEQFEIDPRSIRAGSLWGQKGLAVARVDADEGKIHAFLFATKEVSNPSGSLLEFDVVSRSREPIDEPRAEFVLNQLSLNEENIELQAEAAQEKSESVKATVLFSRESEGVSENIETHETTDIEDTLKNIPARNPPQEGSESNYQLQPNDLAIELLSDLNEVDIPSTSEGSIIGHPELADIPVVFTKVFESAVLELPNEETPAASLWDDVARTSLATSQHLFVCHGLPAGFSEHLAIGVLEANLPNAIPEFSRVQQVEPALSLDQVEPPRKVRFASMKKLHRTESVSNTFTLNESNFPYSQPHGITKTSSIVKKLSDKGSSHLGSAVQPMEDFSRLQSKRLANGNWQPTASPEVRRSRIWPFSVGHSFT